MYTGVIYFMLILLTGFSSVKENANTQRDIPCGECDYIVQGYHNNGKKLNIRPGQVICFDATVPYEKIFFSHINGTKENPIIIRNCGGVARISSPGGFAVKFEQSSHFKFIGDGEPDSTYGLKLTTRSGFYLSLEKFTTDFEIARIEVAGANKNGIGEGSGFAGIGIKTSPYIDCDLFSDSTRQAWIMRNVSVHHNYIHDTGGEGMYIGHGFYKGRIENKCTVKTYSHSIKGLRVHNNLIENTGFDGMQIKNADEDCEIYNNTIRNYGCRNEGAHNEGLFIGKGVTGKIYNNFVDTGTGHGIQFQGMGNNQIYNNVVINAGQDGFNGSGSKMGVYIPDGYFMIYNNTIYNSARNGFVFYNNDGGKKIIKNNLVVRAGHKLTSKGAILDSSNNIFTQNTNAIMFRDTLGADLRLLKGSPAIDAGVDMSRYQPDNLFDCEKNVRPRGNGYDIGAYEIE